MDNLKQNKMVSSKTIILFWVFSPMALIPGTFLFNRFGVEDLVPALVLLSSLIVVLLFVSVFDKRGVTRGIFLVLVLLMTLIRSFMDYLGNNFNTTNWLNTGLKALPFWPFFIFDVAVNFFCLYVAYFIAVRIIKDILILKK